MLLRNFVATATMYPSGNGYYKVRDAKGDVISTQYLSHLMAVMTSGANYNESGITLNNQCQ